MSFDTNQAVKNTATTILSLLEAKNYELIAPLAKELLNLPEQNLYLELGKLARELHELIKNINLGEEEESATDKLHRVITLTESAANKTMDGIDRILPLNQHLQDEASSLLNLLKQDGPESLAQPLQKNLGALQSFLALVPKHSASIQQELQKILVAQNYQDLSGQAIKQIIAVVNTLQTRLIKLVAIAHDAKRLSQLNLDKDTTVAQTVTVDKLSNQDEVDDLLSSLGF